jgi:glycosyltransferase involved in cell wall biosynthesis
MNKIKVIWVCHFSNRKIREKLHLSKRIIYNIIRNLLHKSKITYSDFAVWITNGVEEFEKNNEIELHVISPHSGMKYSFEYFILNDIHYHFFKPEADRLIAKFYNKILNKKERKYKKNRKKIKQIIERIQPDIIHMYGVENPYYSMIALDIDEKKYPFFVTLQTLMSDPIFYKYRHKDKSYDFRVSVERKIIKKATFIGTSTVYYRNIIWERINPDAVFFDYYLALSEKGQIENNIIKEYDFVYFAASIEKAIDIAIEAFALAHKKNSSITLNVIGDVSYSFKQQLKNRINELKINNSVFFSGKLQTHENVLTQIQKSKFALLPLKTDMISGTIREAMFYCIPIITTETAGTPILNEKRESVLIAEQGDFQTLADNMLKLLESEELADKLRKNALVTVNELWNNSKDMKKLLEVYKAIIAFHRFNQPIPKELSTKNPLNHYEE